MSSLVCSFGRARLCEPAVTVLHATALKPLLFILLLVRRSFFRVSVRGCHPAGASDRREQLLLRIPLNHRVFGSKYSQTHFIYRELHVSLFFIVLLSYFIQKITQRPAVSCYLLRTLWFMLHGLKKETE